MIYGSILVAQSRGVIIMSDNSKRVFGYCRVSSKGQNLDRQLKALLDFGVLKRDIFCDETSGKNFDRPKYKELKSLLQAGDLLVVLDLDRLGRNYAEMEREWRIITKEIKCDIEVINFPLISTSNKSEKLESKLISDIVLSLLAYVAERERESIRARQREGIECAKHNGKVFGRPKIEKPDNFSEVFLKVLHKEITNRYAMNMLGLKPNTYYAFAKEEREKLKKSEII